MRKFSLVFLVLYTTLSFAQVLSQKVESSKSYNQADGLVYALPKVVLRLDVWVEKTEYIKGPYAYYAERLLGLSEVISENKMSYDISNVMISKSYVPDVDQLYFMDFSNASNKSGDAVFIKMNESGIINGLSVEESSTENMDELKLVESIQKGSSAFKYYADANLVDKVDTIIRRVDIDTATIEKAIIKRSSIEKDISQRAQDAATYYMEIRQNRMELISGFQEISYSLGALSLMNNELKQLEDNYLNLFAGKTLLTDEHFVFYFTPSSEQSNIIAPIFKFSKEYGLTYLTSSGGEKVSIAIKSNGLAEKLSDVDMSSSINGIAYRFPETAEVWVKYSAHEYDKQLMQIPQLGRLQVLNPKQNVFELYPTSGGVKMMELKK